MDLRGPPCGILRVDASKAARDDEQAGRLADVAVTIAAELLSRAFASPPRRMSTTQSTLREPDAPRVPFVRRASVDHSGRVLAGRYTLLRRIASGGSATVYEAAEPRSSGRVAIKVLDTDHADGPAIERFLQEARAATRLRSDHVIRVVDYGRETIERGRELAYIVMERLEGEDLAATLELDGPLRWTRVLAIAKQVCEALIVAHTRGVVHCDIKPGNCFRIARGGTTDFIKVLDFGVASFASKETGLCSPPGDDRRKSGPVIGTPGYMPDEQLRGGPYDHRVDIFALGVLMYRLLTNKMPYAGGGLYAPRRPQSGPCPLLRAAPRLELPDSFEAVILKSVASDPDARYQSAAELLVALEEVERETMPPSRLPDDPLAWDDDTERAANELAARAPSRLPDDPLAWGDEDDGEPTEEEPALAARSATDVCRAALSHTEMSLTRVAIALPEPRRRRSAPHHGLWMLAGFVTSLATTSMVRMFLL